MTNAKKKTSPANPATNAPYVLTNTSRANGTHRFTEVSLSPVSVIRHFGEGNECEDSKVTRQWVFRRDDLVFTLYDWKATRLYDLELPTPEELWTSEKPFLLHVGSKSPATRNDVADFVDYLRRSVVALPLALGPAIKKAPECETPSAVAQSPVFLCTLPFRSEQIDDPDSNYDVSVWRSVENECELQGDSHCETVSGLYYGSAEDEVTKCCPRHFYEMHAEPGPAYRLVEPADAHSERGEADLEFVGLLPWLSTLVGEENDPNRSLFDQAVWRCKQNICEVGDGWCDQTGYYYGTSNENEPKCCARRARHVFTDPGYALQDLNDEAFARLRLQNACLRVRAVLYNGGRTRANEALTILEEAIEACPYLSLPSGKAAHREDGRQTAEAPKTTYDQLREACSEARLVLVELSKHPAFEDDAPEFNEGGVGYEMVRKLQALVFPDDCSAQTPTS